MARDTKAINVIRLYEDFLNGKRYTKAQIQQKLEVSKKTIDRYINEFQEHLGLEAFMEGRRSKLWFLPAAARNFQPKLDRFDALALHVAITLLEQYGGDFLSDAVATVRDELKKRWFESEAAMKEGELWRRTKFHPIRFLPYRVREDGKDFETVVTALADKQKLTFEYRATPKAGSRPSWREHTVSPYSLVFHKGGFYLIGLRDRAENDSPTTFLLARMRNVRVVSGAYYPYPSNFDPKDCYPQISGMLPGKTEKLVAWFEDRFFDYLKNERDWDGKARVRREDGRVRFEAELCLNDELLNWLLGWGDLVEVESPAWYRDQLADKARRVARVYDTRKKTKKTEK